MGMMGTLAKVAIGIAVAKGVSGMMNRGASSGGGAAPQGGASGRTGGGGLGDILEQLGGGGSRGQQGGAPSSGGGLGDILGQLSGRGGSGGGLGGGLGDLLGQLAGGAAAGGAARGGQQQRADEIMPPPPSSGGGSVFDEMLGNAPAQRDSGGSFGDMFNDAMNRGGDPAVQPSQSEEAVAALMLRAMIQAAKSDGHIDEEEKARLLENLDEVSEAERRFVQAEMAAPIDIDGLVAQVPAGLEQQVYAMSLAGIRLDDQAEAQYLHSLAQGLGIEPQVANAIHDQLEQPRIYS
ncbi:DUF533 domain-containing protein [Pseudahrensia aquimaris]|uniref:DUF533 domain-containing protein n=1 Tax=Pseudahrensia aquimaris TaxID=744461 RepID=A0ABW3FID7_9HYPH